MSGGSYNYLSSAWGLRRLLEHHGVALKDMCNRLHGMKLAERKGERLEGAGLEGADEAAADTAALIRTLNRWEQEAAIALQRLSRVWQAVELYDSYDVGPDAVVEALAEYKRRRSEPGW